MQSNKLYNPQLNGRVSGDGDIKVIGTPKGQIYDLTESHLIGKDATDDAIPAVGFGIPDQVNVAGFQGDGQRIIYLNLKDHKAVASAD